jgi:hypothetical protein
MTSFQITHIIPDRSDPDRRIDAVYGPGCGLLYLDEAIRYIRSGHTFWTWVGLRQAEVHYIPPSIFARHHLTTSRDGFLPNNLLSLPQYGR